jgi:hypothetical protein
VAVVIAIGPLARSARQNRPAGWLFRQYRRNFAAPGPEMSGKPRAIRAALLPIGLRLFILPANAVQR